MWYRLRHRDLKVLWQLAVDLIDLEKERKEGEQLFVIKSSTVEYGSRKNSGVVQKHPGETIGCGSSMFLWTVTDGL